MCESNSLAVDLDDAGGQRLIEPVGVVISVAGCGLHALRSWKRERGDDESGFACRVRQLLEAVAHELAEALRYRKRFTGCELDFAALERTCDLEREEGI